MKRAVKCVVSFMLAIVCLFSYSLADTAYALSNEVGYRGYINSVADELTAAPSETLPDSPLMYEDESGREENIKRFVREDRAVEAVIYPYPVHYDKEGEWADIDNRLVAEQRADGTSVYTNQAAPFNVYFADNISSDELVRVEKDGYVISWRMADRSANAVATIGSQASSQMAISEASANDMRILPNLSSVITYPGALNGADISYVVGPTGIRELITVDNAAQLSANYTMEVTCSGLAPMAEGGEIRFFDADSDEVFKITAPIIMDAAGEETSDITLQLVPMAELQMIDELKNFSVEVQPSETNDNNLSETEDDIAGDDIVEETPAPTEETGESVNGDDTEKAEETIEETNEPGVAEQLEPGTALPVDEGVSEPEPTTSGNEDAPEAEPVLPTEEITEGDEAELVQNTDEADLPETGLSDELIYELEELQERINAGEAIDRISGLVSDNGIISFAYTMIPSREWLLSAERVFPITIDPDLSTGNGFIYIVYEDINNPQNTYPEAELKLGLEYRIYMRPVNLPTLQAGDNVIKATASLVFDDEGEESEYPSYMPIEVHKIIESWHPTLVGGYQPFPAYEEKVSSIYCETLTASPTNRRYIDITSIIRDSISTGENNGIALVAPNDCWRDIKYYAGYSTGDNTNPFFSLIYINGTGIEDYWTYHSQSVGRAGTISINDHNGNLTLIHNDINIYSGACPINLYHVFNTNDKETDIGYGNGWRLNYAQTLSYEEIDDDIVYFKHIDGDGTAHYYYCKEINDDSILCVNEMDKDTTLVVNSSNRIIKDKIGNQLVFDASGRLYQIIDNNGNSMSIAYNSAGRITSIVDGANRTTSLSYSNGRLSFIDSPDGLDVSYSYDTSGRLTAITYADNKISQYAYDSTGNLLSALNHDGYYVCYTYTEAAPHRVVSIQEYANSVAGGSLSIAYGWNSTTFTDNQGRKSIYQFNNAGQTVAIRDVDGSAQYCAFNSQDRTVTQLKTVSKLQKTSINLLSNHNMENTGAWSLGSGASYSTADKFMGSRSIKLSGAGAYAAQQLTLQAGKTYTLSAYFKGSDGARLAVSYGTATIESLGVMGASSSWQRESLTFTVPTNAGSSVNVQLKLPGDVSGSVYADCVMLEQADAMNRYNLLENSDFNSNTIWSRGSGLDSNDAIVSVSGSLHPDSLSSAVYKITGSTTADKVVSQTLPISGSTGDCYTFGGWAQMNTVPAFTKNAGTSSEVNYGQRKLRLGFVGASETKYYEASFNPDNSEWQYICGAAVAPFNYTAIVFSFEYNYNCNDAYFDGMQVFKEEFCQSYTYDDDGNVVSVKGLAEKNSSFEYNGSNDLIKATDAKGNKFNYTYDSKHNLLSAVSESGMKYTFTYDSKGNALTSRTGSDSEYIQTSATYTSVGSFVSSVTDARGKSVSYGYNTDKGLRTSVTDANGNVAAYSYDSMNRLSGLTQGNAQVGYTYDDDELIGISHNGFSYGMTYDLFGHTLATKVNSDVLSQNTYDNSRGLLTSAQYGNGLNIHYEYDVLDRITEVRFGSTKMYSYSYDGDGNLQRMVDNLRGITTSYYYDLSGRLIRSASSDGSEYLYEYDLNDNLTKLHQSAGGSSWVTEYTYDKDNRPVTVKVNGKTITDSYNATGTRSSRVYGFATPYTVSFGYLAGANGSKTTMLQSYRNGSDAAYTYTYDNNGNVTAISQGAKSAAYTYDALNQLTRVNDGFTNKTTTYTYDNAGNILERKEYAYTTGTLGTPTATFAYEYDSEWKDKLVSYNGETISYDEIGNPVSYRGYTMAWQGKRLESLSGDGLTASYTYDEQGIRSGKTINGVTTSFSYNGSLLMAQVAPGKSLLFSYDANGQAVSVNYNGTEYYYLRNGQNDIVGLMDESGVRVVEYIYDAWGKLISTTGTLATTLGADNPFRYRGYYYDTETGLYYLTTRYYDPEVCRFISADVYMSTGQGVLGGNMWAYCLNNPLIYEDSQGKIGILGTLLIGTAIGAAFGFIGNCITNLIAGDNILDGWALATISGAATGLLATSGLGVAGQAIGNAIISAGANIYQQSQSGNSFDWLEFGMETAWGFAGGLLGGAGVLSKVPGSEITNASFGSIIDKSFTPNSEKVLSRLCTSARISATVTVTKSGMSGIYKRAKKKAAISGAGHNPASSKGRLGRYNYCR